MSDAFVWIFPSCFGMIHPFLTVCYATFDIVFFVQPSVRGDVKLFDFGLATVMPPFGDPYEDKFNMSGAGKIYVECIFYLSFISRIISHNVNLLTGSPRYMAPEVLIDPPDDYNMKADVYTFGIVLWEIFSLEVPFSHIKRRDELVEFVGEFYSSICYLCVCVSLLELMRVYC